MKAKIILLMGVSSSGKTTIGERLSQILNWPFFDGDSFHPPENIEKMRKGAPLNDQDRSPWLQAVREKIESERAKGSGAIFACSALRERYREILISGVADLVLVHLSASQEKLRERALRRVHQYMPASLLDSQFEALEVPQNAVVVSVEGEIDGTVAELISQLQER